MAARGDYDALVVLQCVLWCVMRCDVMHSFLIYCSVLFLCRCDVLYCVVMCCTVLLCVVFLFCFHNFFPVIATCVFFVLLCCDVMCCDLMFCVVLICL